MGRGSWGLGQRVCGPPSLVAPCGYSSLVHAPGFIGELLTSSTRFAHPLRTLPVLLLAGVALGVAVSALCVALSSLSAVEVQPVSLARPATAWAWCCLCLWHALLVH